MLRNRQHLLRFYGGPRRRFCDNVTWLILELSGMCGTGRRSRTGRTQCFFWLYLH